MLLNLKNIKLTKVKKRSRGLYKVLWEPRGRVTSPDEKPVKTH